MDVTLTAETGRVLGSRSTRRLRAEGKIPGVVYGLGADPVPVTVAWPDLRRVLTTDAGLNALIELTVDGEHNLTIVKDLQRDPVRRDVTHVDFIRIDATADIEVEVPVILIGESEELEYEGALVDHVLHELVIKAKPGRIPNEVEVDVSGLTAGNSVRVADIRLPEGVTTEIDPEDPVALGYIPRVEVEEPVEGEEGEEGELVEGEEPGEGAEASGEGDDSGDAGDAGDE
jgi:large subunit ribosomal protein L25